MDEIAETFVRAIDGYWQVKGFLQHPSLKYNWIRFLPINGVADLFWYRLRDRILERVKESKLFFSSSDTCLLPNELRIVSTEYRDEAGDTLLPDHPNLLRSSPPSQYLSDQYGDEDLSTLGILGVDMLTPKDFIKRLVYDLDDSSTLRLHSKSCTAVAWHSKVARRLQEAIKEPACKELLQKLKVIPLSTGNWARSRNASIYFPTVHGVDIPGDLQIALVAAKAVENPDRRKLFDMLGVKECTAPTVFSLIEQRYPMWPLTDLDTLSHVKFLFWHNTYLPKSQLKIFIRTQGTIQARPTDTRFGWIYSPRSEAQYSPAKLFNSNVPDELTGEMNFAWSKYYDMLELCGIKGGKSGKEWFETYFTVKNDFQLANRGNTTELSPEILYIAEQMPSHLLHVLEVNWPQYQDSDDWDEFLSTTEIPILNSSVPEPLNAVYLPVPHLKSIADRIKPTLSFDPFSFIEELDGSSDVEMAKFRVLRRFGVGIEEDVRFWLELLSRVSGRPGVQTDTVFDIYQNIQKYRGEEDLALVR